MKLMKSLMALAALFCAVTFVSAADECADKVKCAVKDAKCAVEKAAEAKMPQTLCELKKKFPNAPKLTEKDELFDYYMNLGDGSFYMVYANENPATVYSNSLKAGDKHYDGAEIMTIKPIGFTKGKVKLAQSGKVVAIKDGLAPSVTLNKGDVVALFQPSLVNHDSLNTKDAGKCGSLPSWGEALYGLWTSTGIYDIIS
ncbi:MAG: hypothetical protein IJ992_01650, partial [Lentisphaeria bacterium]|nr:hypothetical protein [Lentisphaeria bacterium]